MSEEAKDQPIDEEVRRLMSERIESFEHLQLLLHLHRHRERAWSAQELSDRLRIPSSTAESALEHLQRHQLLAASDGPDGPGFCYAPADATLASVVDRLVRAYDESLLELMKLMSHNAIERARTKALRFFSDAFVLGRKKDG
jgi:DNA-binding IscR family transcriptional regulator